MKNIKNSKTILALILSVFASQAQANTSLKRFEPNIGALKSLAQDAGSTEPGDVTALRDLFIKKDARKFLFRIEGLLRLYRTTNAETAKPLLKKIKELEDVLGDYTAKSEYIDYATKANADAAALAVLEAGQTESKVYLNKLLQTWFLQSEPYIDTFAIGLSQLRDRSDQELIEAFKTEVREVAKTEFDLNLLEDGIHELRRQVRWLNIYAEALGDLFFVKDDASIPDDFRKLESMGKVGEAIEVEKSFTRKLSKFLTAIGALKDAAEPAEALVHAYVKSSVAKDTFEARAKVSELMEAQNSKYPDVSPVAKEIVSEFNLQAVLETWLEILGD